MYSKSKFKETKKKKLKWGDCRRITLEPFYKFNYNSVCMRMHSRNVKSLICVGVKHEWKVRPYVRHTFERKIKFKKNKKK